MLLDRDFADTKAEGELTEWLLLDLLAGTAGWTVQPHQANWDSAAEGSAARAYGPDGEIHLPDLEVIAPHRIGVEVKSKEPRQKDGSIGWDAKSLQRAERWQRIVNAPVIYVIRDKTIAPLPARRDEPDKVDAWYFATLLQLRQHKPERITKRGENWEGDMQAKTTWFWPREIFLPLSLLLEDGFTIAPVLLRRPALPALTLPFGADRLL